MSGIETRPVGPSTSPAAIPDPAALPASPPSAATTPSPSTRAVNAARALRLVQGRPNQSLQLAAPQADAAPGCSRQQAPADGPRHLVVSHPFDDTGERAATFEVLNVGPDGALARPGRTFNLGTTAFGTIAFTPDGQVGLVALDDGKIGVFRLDADGKPTVVHEGFAGTFHAGKVVVDPRGDRALVIDRNTRENGGGIYQVTIACDGSLTDQGRLIPAKAPGAIAFTGDRMVVAAADAGDKTPPPSDKRPPDNVHLFDRSQPPAKLGSTEAFGNDQVLVGGAALTSDGKTLLVGDMNQFGDFFNQVAVVDVRENGVQPVGVIDLPDPEAIATSPFGNVAIVTSPLNDRIFVLDREGPQGTWRLRGDAPTQGSGPLIPGDLAAIEHGTLRGHVFISENVSVRHLAFKADGAIVDLGSLQLGDQLRHINGAIGVNK